MTAPPPAPRSRRMLAFYASTGVVLALFVGAWFAWTPLRIWYWHRNVRQSKTEVILFDKEQPITWSTERVDAATRLVRLGQAAGPALDRLLRSEDRGVRRDVFAGIGNSSAAWTIPIVIAACRREKDSRVGAMGLAAAGVLTGREPLPSDYAEAGTGLGQVHEGMGPSPVRYSERLRDLLAWWEREGKAKYGRGE